MKKKIFLTLICLILLIAVLGGIKALQIGRMIEASSQFVQPPEPVTVAKAVSVSWEAVLPSIGSLTAVQGVTVAAELPGKVVEIVFSPGLRVNKGDLLLRQDTSSEEAQLPGAEASLTLARQNISRVQALITEGLVTRARLDAEQASFQQAQAAVDDLRSQIAKKTIRAPFSGRLGIRLVNLGQSLRAGDEIVSLQTLSPIFVDFQLPQQHMNQLRRGLPVRVYADSLPDRQLSGEITAVNPQVNATTRSIGVQATLLNAEELLRPGMFVSVEVVLPKLQTVLSIPATAVLYAPFGDSVFIVEEKQEEDGKKHFSLRQQFIRLGEKRGDFVSVLSGLSEGENVVSTGVFKLRNGQTVVVDNSLAPEFRLNPQPENN
ncbi:MAG: efflux RND transporter periplasmic adaptor subunit [Nitrospiraceae bacterium]|nr:MAG: efflux RND transporter periplasmic adaptor subunit [Nitrospiraceae bacterium]